MYKRALKAAPFFNESLLNLSATYYNTRKVDSALSVINKVQRIKLSYRDDKNYKIFLNAILLAKVKIHFDSAYGVEKGEAYINEAATRGNIVELYTNSNLSFDTFLVKLEKEMLETTKFN